MYELIDASQLGFPELDRPLMIVKYDEAFGRRRLIFSLTLHDRNQAVEILETLNHTIRCQTCGSELSPNAPFCCEVSDAA